MISEKAKADAAAAPLTITAEDLRLRLDLAPMSRVQVLVVVATVLLSALDGFDVLSTSFVAPVISRAWEMNKTGLGVVLSSGLVGMAIGSLGLAPFADVVGRRPTVLAGVSLMGVGSLLSAFCRNPAQLSMARVVTGLGVGLVIALITSLAAEFSDARRRSFCVAAMAVGYPAGGVAGGMVAATLLGRADWPAVFIVGAVAAGVLLVLLAALLPESPAYLVGGRARNMLPRLNRVLARLGQPPVSGLTALCGPEACRLTACFSPPSSRVSPSS